MGLWNLKFELVVFVRVGVVPEVELRVRGAESSVEKMARRKAAAVLGAAAAAAAVLVVAFTLLGQGKWPHCQLDEVHCTIPVYSIGCQRRRVFITSLCCILVMLLCFSKVCIGLSQCALQYYLCFPR